MPRGTVPETAARQAGQLREHFPEVPTARRPANPRSGPDGGPCLGWAVGCADRNRVCPQPSGNTRQPHTTPPGRWRVFPRGGRWSAANSGQAGNLAASANKLTGDGIRAAIVETPAGDGGVGKEEARTIIQASNIGNITALRLAGYATRPWTRIKRYHSANRCDFQSRRQRGVGRTIAPQKRGPDFEVGLIKGEVAEQRNDNKHRRKTYMRKDRIVLPFYRM